MNIKNISDSIVFSNDNLTKRIIFSDRQVLNFVLNLRPGQTIPAHRHEQSAVVLFALSGRCKIRVNDETQDIRDGAVLLVRGEDDFEITEVSDDTSLYVTISPNPSSELYSQPFG